MMESATLIGVDVGGTHLRVGVVRGKKVIWEKRSAAELSQRCKPGAPEEAVQIVVTTIAAAVDEALSVHPTVGGIGLAFPGFLDPGSGRLVSSPNIPGLRNADLAAPLAGTLGLPVVVENDALAAAWGEYALHPRRPDSLIYLGLGTGVGGGLILNGAPYRGRHGVAMEAGHLTIEPEGRQCGCGNLGCLERYASASGVSLAYREVTSREVDAKVVAERARNGEVAAREAFEQAGNALGKAVAHLFKILDVPDMVIGGGLVASWDLMERAFFSRLEEDLFPLLRGKMRIRISESGDRAGMLGAAGLVKCRPEIPFPSRTIPPGAEWTHEE